MLGLYTNIATLLCTAIAFIYGALRFFRRGKALYLQMIVCGVGCMMLGRLFQVVMLLTGGYIAEGFHVGILGTIGCFLFFFSANYGQMDHLADDGGTNTMKYRLAALAAPAVIAAGFIPIALSNTTWENKCTDFIVVLFIMQASYFNLKHLIMPDVDLGIIRCIRGYNFLALIFALLSMAEMTLWIVGNGITISLVCVLNCVASLLIMPMLERGVKKWTI